MYGVGKRLDALDHRLGYLALAALGLNVHRASQGRTTYSQVCRRAPALALGTLVVLSDWWVYHIWRK